MNSTPPGPPPCLPPFQCVKVEEWLKSSEKTKVKLICTPHRSPLQKITTQKTRTSLTLQLIDFPSHSPTETHTHSSTSTARHPQFTLSSAFTARTRNSPTLQLLPHEPAIHPLFNFYRMNPEFTLNSISHFTHSSTSTTRNPEFTHSSTFYMVCQTWPFHISLCIGVAFAVHIHAFCMI